MSRILPQGVLHPAPPESRRYTRSFPLADRKSSRTVRCRSSARTQSPYRPAAVLKLARHRQHPLAAPSTESAWPAHKTLQNRTSPQGIAGGKTLGENRSSSSSFLGKAPALPKHTSSPFHARTRDSPPAATDTLSQRTFR